MTDDLLHYALIYGGMKRAHHHLRNRRPDKVIETLAAIEASLRLHGYVCRMCTVPLAPGHISEGTSLSPHLRWLFCSTTCRDTWHDGLAQTATGTDERRKAS